MGLPRELADLDEPLCGEAFKVEVREADGDAEALGERPLCQRAPFSDGRQDLEISLLMAFHCAVWRSIFEHTNARGAQSFFGSRPGLRTLAGCHPSRVTGYSRAGWPAPGRDGRSRSAPRRTLGRWRPSPAPVPDSVRARGPRRRSPADH